MGPARGEVDFEPVKSSVIVESESAFSEEFVTVLTNLSDAETVKSSNMGYNHAIVELVDSASREEAEQKILDKEIEVIYLVDGENEHIEVKVGDGARTYRDRAGGNDHGGDDHHGDYDPARSGARTAGRNL